MREEETGLFDLKYVYDDLLSKEELTMETLVNKLRKHDIGYSVVSYKGAYEVEKTIVTIREYNMNEGFVDLRDCVVFYSDDTSEYIENVSINKNVVHEITGRVKQSRKTEYEDSMQRNNFLS